MQNKLARDIIIIKNIHYNIVNGIELNSNQLVEFNQNVLSSSCTGLPVVE